MLIVSFLQGTTPKVLAEVLSGIEVVLAAQNVSTICPFYERLQGILSQLMQGHAIRFSSSSSWLSLTCTKIMNRISGSPSGKLTISSHSKIFIFPLHRYAAHLPPEPSSFPWFTYTMMTPPGAYPSPASGKGIAIGGLCNRKERHRGYLPVPLLFGWLLYFFKCRRTEVYRPFYHHRQPSCVITYFCS